VTDAAPKGTALAWVGLLGGLVISGTAGIVNQVLWQRALKIFLGGSETLSSMVVVLVFLFGLGVGAAVAGRFAPALRNPLRALALVELALALGNAVVALLLGLDITESVYAMQRMAVSTGIPLRLMYALCSGVILLPPTLLMGATLPFASEGLQRQLRASSEKLVPVLFFVNTVGAAIGAWTASAWLLPALGQRRALFVAVACNALAGLVIGALARRPDAAPATPAPAAAGGALTREELLGGALGFLALGWEMVLFRLLALTHDPVPTTFATGLAAFLTAWSLGVAAAGRVRVPVAASAAVCAGLVVAAHRMYRYELGLDEPWPIALAAAVYVAPCLAFGAMYGELVSRAAKDWGRDVGRYSAINTLGSCLGILFFTLVGYEIPQHLVVTGLAALILAAGAGELLWARTRAGALGAGGVLAAVGLAALGYGFTIEYEEENGVRTYWGRDGVVDVSPDRNVYLDGLWHTRLAEDDDQIGTVYSWLMAFAAVMAHEDPHPKRALVVGGGVGISSGTLSGVEGIEVDTYEINHTLRRVLRDYPEGCLRAYNADVEWRWQDARTGLALDPGQYDVILSAPLYLRQAGSSLLLSREYLRLLKSRLAPGGTVAVYSNEGSPAQTRLVQATLAELFAYRVTWYDGLVTVAADHPIELTEEEFRARLQLPDRLYAEARLLDGEMKRKGGLWRWYDGDAVSSELADQVITDDHPLVEYPDLADAWVGVR
jgi:spermidine synthase